MADDLLDASVEDLLGTGDDADAGDDLDALLDSVGQDDDQTGPDLIPPDGGESIDLSFGAIAETNPELTDGLVGEWGNGAEFEANMEFARQAMLEIQTDELHAAVEDAGLGNSPVIFKALASIGRRLAAVVGDHQSDNRRDDTMADTNVEKIQEKLDKLHALQHSPDLRERDKYKTERVQDALRALYDRQAGGGEPIVGRDQRAV